jgi:transposase
LLERAAEAFGGDAPKAGGPDVRDLHAKIGQLALENDFLERARSGVSTGRAQSDD